MYNRLELDSHLVTLAEYEKLSPCDQGYVIYMQAEHPGSELKDHQQNPYKPETLNWKAWNRGQTIGMLDAQDSEE